MLCFPNAKINLGLNIVERRSDGYHNIETVFYPVKLCDALEIVPSRSGKKITFTASGLDVGGDPDKNLAVKAYRSFDKYKKLPNIDMYLHKYIPFGAGLGGGSSDAAFALRMLNDFAGIGYSEKQLEEIASELGADCAFFIRNRPVFASGIGNIFESVEISLKNYRLVLIKPDIFVSTPEAYSMVTPNHPEISLKEIIKQPVKTWKETMINDFEVSVFTKYPEIKEIKEKLYDSGALYASMSGSGSSVFGIFETLPDNVQRLFPEYFVWTSPSES